MPCNIDKASHFTVQTMATSLTEMTMDAIVIVSEHLIQSYSYC